MISFNNIKKSYNKVTVLDVPQWTIKKGETVGLVGNNGAGKTTAFSLLLDLIKATEGNVTIEGEDVSMDENWKTFTSSFLDESYLIDFLTPDEYFNFIGSLYNLNQATIDEFVGGYSEFFNDEIIGVKKYIRDLSKGNQKKVGLIGSLIGNPSLVVLDEPFSNLDPTSQIRLKRLIREAAEGRTFLISSHDLNHVVEVCDRIVVLEKGLIVKDLINSEETIQEIQDYFDV
ncbi:MAG: ABC transporter ATP-binding protein [Saprospiraceae bacterium]|nr:ABC transporter ATP-binding protein [Saprospiraceae bacterium]